MSIATKLAKLKTIKQDIKSALEEKGQTPSNVFSTYANNIRAIETGGGSGGETALSLLNGTITTFTGEINEIKPYAFYNCLLLENANIISDTTYIGDSAFYNCSSLSSELNFPQCISIGDSAFYNCSSLSKLKLGLIETIKKDALNGTNNITELDCSKLTTIENYAFRNSYIKKIHIENYTSDETKISYKFGYTNAEEIIIDNLTLNGIGDNYSNVWYMFANNNSLKNVVLGVNKKLGYFTFMDCINLETCKFTGTGTFIIDRSFYNTHKLNSVECSANTNFGYETFYNCYSLKKLLITNTSSVKYIQHNTFYNCLHLTGTTNSIWNPNGLKDCYIYVHASLLSEYKVATNWTKYASQIVGYQDYAVGDELVNYANDTYTTCTWYSDEAMTIKVVSVENNGRYYCKLEA